MNKISLIILFAGLYSFSCNPEIKPEIKPEIEKETVYNIARLNQPVVIDGNWDKVQWQSISAIEILNYMGTIPKFLPEVMVKMMYDEENVYIIFKVQDRYVRCLTTEYNGPVYQDSAVEFFFSPCSSQPLLYFNLEVNCGGIPLMHYNPVPGSEFTELATDDIRQIEIAHSLPQITDPEISDPVTWTLEYRLPLSILEKYSRITHPEKGVVWKANFYKIAENNSNPHYMTWSVIKSANPDFHRPEFFGKLIFQ